MNVVNDYLDILQNIEASIVSVYKNMPELRDPDVIQALERLISLYTREKKKLPPLPVVLPERAVAVLQTMQAVCETRMDRTSNVVVQDELVGYRVPLRLMIPCLERLLQSANTWHKRGGQRGYLGFVSQFV